MSITKMKADLYCVNCRKNTPHEVIYIGEDIEKITCLECKAFLEIDENLVMSTYAMNILKRVSSKPERMSNEIKKDLSKFLCSIPFRVVTKPYRMVKEYKELKGITGDKRVK
ncbi:hypothetical protein [Maledivibacter halophilus]|uniref:Bh protein n=1 Tax=Maledivibacter halophilus TaxID=36842 RepID=A0A1T5MI25_9FIRM|nr:hypothetical protein [Maledivibacter halophilus]SKC87845.1 hypothetical protein SAMN02194393_04761 [Maledivibacter halophilus]